MNIDKFGRHLTVGVKHQTSIDKFGRYIDTDSDFSKHVGESVVGDGVLSLTSDGQYDVAGKRLCNVQTPLDDNDCANKAYVDKTYEDIQKVVQKSSSSNSNVFTFFSDLHKLDTKVEKFQKDQTLTNQDITQDIDYIKQSLNKQQKQLDKLSVSEADAKLELHNNIVKQHDINEEFRHRFDQLINSYDKSIENLHKKLKPLEALIQP